MGMHDEICRINRYLSKKNVQDYAEGQKSTVHPSLLLEMNKNKHIENILLDKRTGVA